MTRLSMFLFILNSFTATAQELSSPVSWWIDKPVTSSDSHSLVERKYGTMKIYYLTPLNTGFDTLLWGEMTFTYDSTDVLSATWKFRSTRRDAACIFYAERKRIDKKRKIEQRIGDRHSQFIFTHHLDSAGRIDSTNSRFVKGVYYESRYNFNSIHYKYNANGLLEESTYYNDWSMYRPHPIYKLLFHYE